MFVDSREVTNTHDFMKKLSDDPLDGDDEQKSDSDTFVKSIFR